MKRIAWLLSFSLILLGAFHGVAAAQQLSGLTGQLDGDSDPLDKVKKPVDDVTNQVEDSADKVVEDSSEVAEDAGDTAGSVADEPTKAGTTSSDISAPDSNDSKTKLTRSTKRSGRGSKDASGAESSDTDKVADVGNTIGSASENDEQRAAETDADESEGSVLSSTGAQILAWLVLAGFLIAIGVALIRRRRTGSRA